MKNPETAEMDARLLMATKYGKFGQLLADLNGGQFYTADEDFTMGGMVARVNQILSENPNNVTLTQMCRELVEGTRRLMFASDDDDMAKEIEDILDVLERSNIGGKREQNRPKVTEYVQKKRAAAAPKTHVTDTSRPAPNAAKHPAKPDDFDENPREPDESKTARYLMTKRPAPPTPKSYYPLNSELEQPEPQTKPMQSPVERPARPDDFSADPAYAGLCAGFASIKQQQQRGQNFAASGETDWKRFSELLSRG